MNWSFTNAAKNAQKTAAKKAENNARAETVRQSAAQAAEARAKKAREAAKKAENQARQAAVEMSKAAAAAERAARAAARGETSNRRNNTNAANRAAKKAAENAEKAAANAKKAQLNVLIENARTQWLNVLSSTMNKNAKKKQGNTIYKRASVKLHPNKHLSEKDIATESFKQLGSLYSEFQKYINLLHYLVWCLSYPSAPCWIPICHLLHTSACQSPILMIQSIHIT